MVEEEDLSYDGGTPLALFLTALPSPDMVGKCVSSFPYSNFDFCRHVNHQFFIPLILPQHPWRGDA